MSQISIDAFQRLIDADLPLLAKPFTIQQLDSAIRQATSLFQS